MKTPVNVAITGAAGQIGYALAFRIASGQMFGPDQPVIFQLLEVPVEKAMNALKGVASNAGAVRLAELASDAMKMPSWRLAREWQPLVQSLKAELGLARQALDGVLAGLRQAAPGGGVGDRP